MSKCNTTVIWMIIIIWIFRDNLFNLSKDIHLKLKKLLFTDSLYKHSHAVLDLALIILRHNWFARAQVSL